MRDDDDTFYAAVASRDRRFEGRFVIAVRTTGVYCRPGCPAPLPKRKNVRFFACSAAAEQEGFRPCMRCRPETSPGTPAWAGTSATVARALRLIDEGALDGNNLEALASRLGVGSRHLRRLFTEHVGASPVAIATTRRVHFARKLIDETRMPMTEVAMSAGFASVRRFNDAVRATFRKPPRELRREREVAAVKRGRGEEDRALSLKLPFFPPYDWDAALAFLAPRAIPGIERVSDGVYARTVGRGCSLEVARDVDESCLRLTVRGYEGELIGLVARIGRLFDLGADPARIAAHLKRDRRLAHLVLARPGLRVPGAWDGFELAVRAVLGQQISVKGATTLSGRIVDTWGTKSEVSRPGLTHVFPAPGLLATADLAGIGLPRARAETIRAVAAGVRDGTLTLDSSRGLDETVARLVALPGIGPWTASYIAMRACGEPDAFPGSDLGLRKAYGGDIDARALEQRAEAWRPWRAYAAMHLWMSGGTASDQKEKTK